ncbi:ATP-dependent Clp protease proteolytic subunit, partial [Micromonospora aurantiaca]|nr:ATP-dependent Clp protease proteolytic subunit [Micromonospora aurantiaca]
LHDRWYTAREALEYGFVDAIVSTFDEVAPAGHRPIGLRVATEGDAR